MKKSILSLIAIAASSALLVSCSMGVVSSKKLDGDWKVTSGTITMTSSYTYGSTTTTNSSTGTYDGSVLSTSQTSGNVTTTVKENLTIDYSFDKSTNAYTSKMVAPIQSTILTRFIIMKKMLMAIITTLVHWMPLWREYQLLRHQVSTH